jgi:large subunit ribosomal protein L21
VLLIADENQQIVGKPTIEGAKVVATVKGEGKEKKIVIFKYKNKTRSSKKTGHRQIYTALSIDEIVQPGVS